MLTTRVNSAKWIRKLCKKYEIEVKHQLRTRRIKAFYVQLIYKAIACELAREKKKDQVQEFSNEVQENLGKHFIMSRFDSYALSCQIVYLPERKFVGELTKYNNCCMFRYSTDGRYVTRSAETVADAIDKMVDKFCASLKSSLIAS